MYNLLETFRPPADGSLPFVSEMQERRQEEQKGTEKKRGGGVMC
jgi:hypothetical protein